MIIELFGLPGSGKSTRARAWADGERIVRVHALPPSALIGENLLFFLRYPLRSFRLLLWLARAPRGLRRHRFMNLFLVHNAKYLRARRISRAGKIALIDQGHFQNLLSLFETPPPDADLARYFAILPQPDLVALCDAPPEVRHARLIERDSGILLDPGTARVRATAELLYPRVCTLLAERNVPHRIAAEGKSFPAFLAERMTYATISRMPTEKAHGASIAHMCTAFAQEGSQVELVIPLRRNPIRDDVFQYYQVPQVFSVRYLRIFDFVGRGVTYAPFFFLDRLAFLRSLKSAHLAPGIVYTREPEIAAAFARTHYAVLELHRWPRGLGGTLMARLARRAALVVCNSRGTEAAAREAGVERTMVAPNGYDSAAFREAETKETARARLDLPHETPIALYAGSLEAHKGVRTLYEAASLLSDALVVVIGGKEREIEELRLRYPRVRFLGNRPYRELADNLAAADVVVLPNTARDEESARFTSPIKVFGYMAAGRPVVASDLPSTREVLDETCAYLVAPDNAEALALGIEEALAATDSGDRVRRARERVAGYTWTERARRILNAVA